MIVRLAAVAAGRDNNIMVLRLVAATLVVFSHSYALTGRPDPLEERVGTASFGLLGVWIFFVLSGFLIAGSLNRNRGLLAYVEARFLRIFPALAMVVVLAALVLGPIVTAQSLSSYFSDSTVWEYIGRNLIVQTRYSLPGVFADNPFPRAVNGSIWSLRPEVFMYTVLGAVYWLRIGSERGLFNAFIILVLMLQFKEPMGSELVPGEVDFATRFAMLCFVIGTFIFNNRDGIPLSLVAGIVLAMLGLASGHSARQPFITCVALAYVIMVLAYHPRLQGRWSLLQNDYSYGLFLFSFPVQQLLVHWFLPIRPLAPLELFPLALLLSLGFAALSWHFLEKPCLAWKGRLFATLRLRRGASVSSKDG